MFHSFLLYMILFWAGNPRGSNETSCLLGVHVPSDLGCPVVVLSCLEFNHIFPDSLIGLYLSSWLKQDIYNLSFVNHLVLAGSAKNAFKMSVYISKY